MHPRLTNRFIDEKTRGRRSECRLACAGQRLVGRWGGFGGMTLVRVGSMSFGRAFFTSTFSVFVSMFFIVRRVAMFIMCGIAMRGFVSTIVASLGGACENQCGPGLRSEFRHQHAIDIGFAQGLDEHIHDLLFDIIEVGILQEFWIEGAERFFDVLADFKLALFEDTAGLHAMGGGDHGMDSQLGGTVGALNDLEGAEIDFAGEVRLYTHGLHADHADDAGVETNKDEHEQCDPVFADGSDHGNHTEVQGWDMTTEHRLFTIVETLGYDFWRLTAGQGKIGRKAENCEVGRFRKMPVCMAYAE